MAAPKSYVLILRSTCQPCGSDILGVFDTLELADSQWQNLITDEDKDWLTADNLESVEVDDEYNLHLKYPEAFATSYIGLVKDPVELEKNCVCVQEVKRITAN